MKTELSRRRFLTLAIGTAAAVAVGCGGEPEPPPPPSTEGGVPAEPPTAFQKPSRKK